MKTRLVLVAAVILVVGLFGGALFQLVLDDGSRNIAVDRHYLSWGQMETQANDLATAVLFDYRVFDLFPLVGAVLVVSASVTLLLSREGKRP
jgi:multisubunit Na+/H+ antiporter MnhB subunit